MVTRRQHADAIRAWALDVTTHAEALRDGALEMGAVPTEALPDPSSAETREQLLGIVEGVHGYEIAPHAAVVIELAEGLLEIADNARTFAAQIESGEVKDPGGAWDD